MNSSARVAHNVKEVADCSTFRGAGFLCAIESPEHQLVRRWIPEDATVLELGARFGTTSCEIAAALKNSGKLVSVEADRTVWDFLEANLKKNKCNTHLLRGILGSQPLQQSTLTGYGARTEGVKYDTSTRSWKVNLGYALVHNVQLHELESNLGLKFDTLLIDCEGCAAQIMDQIGPKIRRREISLILLEADMGAGGADCTQNCMHYTKFAKYLIAHGFEEVDRFNDCDATRNGVVANMPGQWCGEWIWHYAYQLQHPSKISPEQETLIEENDRTYFTKP